MAKIKKTLEGGVHYYPATIMQAVKDPSDGKNVKEKLTELQAEMDNLINIADNITSLNAGGYYSLSTGVGTTANFVVDTGWLNQVVESSEGDVFIVKVRGGESPRPWGFVDAQYNILSFCSSNYSDRERIIAPANTSYLILNSLTPSWSAYVEPEVLKYKSKFEKIGEEIESCNTRINYVDNRVDDSNANIEKLDILTRTLENSKNLININDKDVMLGYRQYSKNPDKNASYNLTGYIKVEGGKSYTFSNYNKSYPDVTYIAYFDQDKNFINYNTNQTIIAVPNDIGYIRLSVKIEAWDMMQLEEGDTITDYESYGVKIKSPIAIMCPTAVFPSKIYLISGKQQSIYHKNYLDKWNPYHYTIAGKEQVANYTWKNLERCFRTNGDSSDPLIYTLYNVDSLTAIQRYSVQTLLSNNDKGTTDVTINVIGDSFTYDGRWISMVKECCPHINTVGMRKAAMDTDVKVEGRGGWHLDYYFKPYISENESFSPFVHPEGFNYYGVVEFWESLVNNNASNSYATNGFDAYIDMFESNGYRKNPSVNDLMYSYADSAFKYWDGTSWIISSVTEADFKFDYSKYVSIWSIASPDVVVVMLGKNDFWYSINESVWSKWKEQMDSLIDSIHSYDSYIKIAVCTPTTADVMPNNAANLNHIIGHRRMWEARKRMIETYDTLEFESSNVYLVDSGVVLDPDYGFVIRRDKPFDYYEGEDVELYDTNTVHPSGAGYKQIGVSVAAFIQYVRD